MVSDFNGSITGSSVALRFFSLYGPWGRPDMAYWKFLDQLLTNQQVVLYGKDGGIRNFTFIDDAVIIMEKLLSVDIPDDLAALNVSVDEPISTLKLLSVLQQLTNNSQAPSIIAHPDYDVDFTWSDSKLMTSIVGKSQVTDIESGLTQFYDWYLRFAFNNKLLKQIP